MKNVQWVKRQVATGETIFYDRYAGKIYRGESARRVVPVDDVWSSPHFDPHAPLKVYCDPSYLCNFTCKHCITRSSPKYDRTGELPTARMLTLVQELASVGVLQMAVGGGEPLAHKDCMQIFRAIVDSGITLVVTTNGSLVTDRVAEDLAEVAPFEMRVSFDGGPSFHDTVRGNGNYQKAVAGLSRLISHNIPATARLTLSTGADDELPKFFDDLASIRLKKVKVVVTKPIGRAEEEGRHLVRPTESVETAQWLMSLGGERGMVVELSTEDFPAPDIIDSKLRVQAPHCGAGFESAYISAKGQVRACVALPNEVFGDISNTPFMDIWLSQKAKGYRCWAAGCKQQRICDGLRAKKDDS